MLTIRYSAMFTATSHPRAFAELACSLAGVELHVAPYVPLRVVVYTLAETRASIASLFEQSRVPHELVALDEVDGAAFAEARAFAASIVTASEVDRICIARMLTDFRLLPANEHRLLLGADVMFLDVPDELLAFAWQARPRAGVAYAVDAITFEGKRYGLRYWHAPLLRGLLGDLYCLAPGVTLPAESIRSCLRLIDSWPRERRFDPAVDDTLTVCEQQAAAILLEPFVGLELPPRRYGHRKWYPGMAALHTHNLERLQRYMKPEHRALAERLVAGAASARSAAPARTAA